MSNLRKRLGALEFPLDYLRDDWQSRLERVTDMMTADRVEANCKVRRRTYCLELGSAFDEVTGTLWLKRGGDLNDALFEALVHRIFRQDVPRYAASAATVEAGNLVMETPGEEMRRLVEKFGILAGGRRLARSIICKTKKQIENCDYG
jgi:hypothetical protein